MSSQRYWSVCPQLRQTLFKGNRPRYLDLAVDKSAIKSTIYEHPEFAAFIASMNTHFTVWRQGGAPGRSGRYRPPAIPSRSSPRSPRTCSPKEQEAILKLEAELESVTTHMAELEEEHGGEEGAFSELDKVNKASVTARLRKLEGLFASDLEAKDEAMVLGQWQKLSNQEAALKKKLKDAEADLDGKAYAKYPKLTDAEVQSLVVDDKWLAALDSMIHGEMDRISQALTQRVKELAERYETPLPKLACAVKALAARVDQHLKRMGFQP